MKYNHSIYSKINTHYASEELYTSIVGTANTNARVVDIAHNTTQEFPLRVTYSNAYIIICRVKKFIMNIYLLHIKRSSLYYNT